MELTQKDIERQDFVDNEIQELLLKLNPSKSSIDWNIEDIALVRELIREIYTEKLNICDEFVFYPYLID